MREVEWKLHEVEQQGNPISKPDLRARLQSIMRREPTVQLRTHILIRTVVITKALVIGLMADI